MPPPPKIAIIGAGLSGLWLAKMLGPLGDVRVFEKSRGVGGRMSTRRAEDFRFDHGAQYMTARGQAFRQFLAPHIAAGRIVEWAPRLISLSGQGPAQPLTWNATRYVAFPNMNSLCKAMAEDVSVQLGAEVSAVLRHEGRWSLQDKAGSALGPFDWVLSTAPAVQTARLMPQTFAGQTDLGRAKMDGCYSLMIGLEQPLSLDWDAAQVRDAPLQWIAVNSAKPGRDTAQSFLCQTTNAWAEANLERDQRQVQDELLSCFRAVTGLEIATPAYVSLHRWRYASVAQPAGQPFLLDAASGLAACGDWCGAGKVEAAFDSASGLGRAIAAQLEGRDAVTPPAHGAAPHLR